MKPRNQHLLLIVVVAALTGTLWLRDAASRKADAATSTTAGTAPEGDTGADRTGAPLPLNIARIPPSAQTARAGAVRDNGLLEARFIVGGSIDGGAANSALAVEDFDGTVADFHAATRSNRALEARNERMRQDLADALRQVDGDATLRQFACSQSLCVMEVGVAGDRRQVDYMSYLQEMIDPRGTQIYVTVYRSDFSNGTTSSRSFFSIEPSIRSVRAPSEKTPS